MKTQNEVERLREELIRIRRDAISVVRQVETLLQLPESERAIKPRPAPTSIDSKVERV